MPKNKKHVEITLILQKENETDVSNYNMEQLSDDLSRLLGGGTFRNEHISQYCFEQWLINGLSIGHLEEKKEG